VRCRPVAARLPPAIAAATLPAPAASPAVFRIEPTKVLAFAKEPHGQTSYGFE
jgi:hypothetical protein